MRYWIPTELTSRNQLNKAKQDVEKLEKATTEFFSVVQKKENKNESILHSMEK